MRAREERLKVPAGPAAQPTVKEYLEWVRNRQVVHFKLLGKPREPDVTLELSKLNSYDDVTAALATKLGMDDPRKLRLTAQNAYSHQPKPVPLASSTLDSLASMLATYGNTTDVLFYEVLDIPLADLERLKCIKVAWYSARVEEAAALALRVPKEANVGELLEHVRTLVDPRPVGPLRLLAIYNNKINRVYAPDDAVDGIFDDYWQIRAEEVAPEEAILGPNDRLVSVVHFNRDSVASHLAPLLFGDPFLFAVRDTDTLADWKARLRHKLGVPAEDFAAWKFGVVTSNKSEYLEDDAETPAARLSKCPSEHPAWDHASLGLDHSSKGRHS